MRFTCQLPLSALDFEPVGAAADLARFVAPSRPHFATTRIMGTNPSRPTGASIEGVPRQVISRARADARKKVEFRPSGGSRDPNQLSGNPAFSALHPAFPRQP